MRRYVVIMVTMCLVLVLAGLGMLNRSTAPASASEQPGIPPDRPAQDSLQWTLDAMTFESNYPNGFTARITPSSTGGAIVRARLVWYGPAQRANQTRRVNVEEGEIDPDTGVISARWEPSATEMVPPWVQIKYHWELRDEAGNVYETEPALAEYEDNTRTWTREESEDAIVFTSDLSGDVKELVLDAMARRHDMYLAVWGASLPYRPRVILFGDYDAWLEWRTADTNTSDTSVVVGQTYDEWGAIVQVLFGRNLQDAYEDLAYGTVVHEVEHLYQNEFLSGRRLYDVPGWFYEGDATFFELRQSYDYEQRVRNMAADDDLPPLLVGVVGGPRIDGKNPRDGYDIGYTFFVWMQTLRGDLSVHHAVMVALAQNTPFIDALEAATGMSKDEIEREWRLWLGASEAAPTLIPTWTPPPFPEPPTPMQFGKSG